MEVRNIQHTTRRWRKAGLPNASGYMILNMGPDPLDIQGHPKKKILGRDCVLISETQLKVRPQEGLATYTVSSFT